MRKKTGRMTAVLLAAVLAASASGMALPQNVLAEEVQTDETENDSGNEPDLTVPTEETEALSSDDVANGPDNTLVDDQAELPGEQQEPPSDDQTDASTEPEDDQTEEQTEPGDDQTEEQTEPVETPIFTWRENPAVPGTVMITKYNGTDTEVTIPSEIDGKKVTSISDTFDENHNITKVSIPKGITSIGDYTFCNASSLKSITLPDTLTSIGECAFSGTALTKLTLPASVKTVGPYAFQGCGSLTDVTFQGMNTGTDGGDFRSFEKSVTYHVLCGSESYRYAVSQGQKFVFTGGHKNVTEVKQKAWYLTSLRSNTVRTENGTKVTKCSVCGEVHATETIAAPKKITLSAVSYTYSGKVRKPAIKVTDTNGKTIATSNYSVTYPSGRKNAGIYEIRIAFKGNSYGGTAYRTFKILPKKMALSSVKKQKKGFTASWKKPAGGITGYQVQYSLKSSMKSAKTKTVKKAGTKTLKVTGLKAKKTYYVRIRAYKDATDANGKTVRLYSAWSGKKKVTTK